jgi:ABC-type transporter Mla MlaB component
MSIRITRTTDVHETVLCVDGQLSSDNVTELTREQRSVNGPLVLDLSNFQSADTTGVATLQKLISMGTRIRGASPYIELLLKGSCPSG